MASIDIEIDEIISGMMSYEKQELVNELYEEGYIADKDKNSDYNEPQNEFDEACLKLFGNGWRLTKEDEAIILKIANKIVA